MNLSANHERLPFMLSYYQSQRPDGTHVQRYINEKAPKLIKVLGEQLTDGAKWAIHSHGAWVTVKTDVSELFERVIVVLPKPEQNSPKLFTPWAEKRVRHLGRYIERTNSGKMVRILTQKQVVIAVLMKRKGYDLQDSKTPLPEPEEIPQFIKTFCREVQMYISWMNDPELCFIQSLKLNVIPQTQQDPILKLTLDTLPTIVGLRGRSIPLSPVTLIRGVIGELAEQIDLRSDDSELDGEGLLGRLWASYRQRRRRRQASACVRELDALAAQIDLLQPDFSQLSKWVFELSGGEAKPLIPPRLLLAALCAGAAFLLYWYR